MFTERSANKVLSPHEMRAVKSYLQKNVPAFGPEIITERVLEKLLKSSRVLKLSANEEYLTMSDKLVHKDVKIN